MRIGGLASGMDTDSMVKQLMKAENMKVDNVKAEKLILEWRKESLNSLNKDFANFILDTKKDLGYNELGIKGSLDWIKTASSSKESVGTATAGKGALGGKHTVHVEKLAEGISGISNTKIKESDWDAKRSVEPEDSGIAAFNFKINGKEIKVSATDSLANIAKKINSSGAGVQASYDSTLEMFFIRTEKEGIDPETKVEFTFDQTNEKGEEDTAQTAINKNGLEAFLDTIKVDLKGFDNTGASKQTTLSINSLGSDILGAEGEVAYNNIVVKTKSNQFELNGVKFNVIDKGDFIVTVTDNADDIVDKVKSFVENYNKIIDKAGSLLNEKQNKSYKPLTDEQREAMSDKEVELWDKRAKSGIIKGDGDVSRMLSSLRSDLYRTVDNASGIFKHIGDIGITTQGYKAGGVGGQLQIDEKKLRDAISRDADGVIEVLFNEDVDYASKDDAQLAKENDINGKNKLDIKRSNSGLFTRIFDNLTLGMKDIISKSGPGEESDLFRKVKSNILIDFVKKGGRYSGKGSVSDLEDDMFKYTKKIDDLNEYLFRKENSYYAKFTAMEKVMQRASAQSGWLSQQFGGGN